MIYMSRKYNNWVEFTNDVLNENNVCCSECGSLNNADNNYCLSCGHKLKKINKKSRNYREFCPICCKPISSDDEYCGVYGHKIERNEKIKVCPICGEWNCDERYCINCGHDFIRNSNRANSGNKRCPNCGRKGRFNDFYCEDCGTKLILKPF